MSLSLLQFSPVSHTTSKSRRVFLQQGFCVENWSDEVRPVQRAKLVHPSLCQCLPLCTPLSRTLCFVVCGIFAFPDRDWFKLLN